MLERMQAKLPDRKLLERWANGEQWAFDVLFKRYYSTAHRYVLKYTRDAMVAEELVMDVMFRIWQKSRTMSPDINFEAYLLKSLKHAVYNHYRSSVLNTVSIDRVVQDNLPHTEDGDINLRKTEMEMLYEETISKLPVKKRQVFRMSREENLTYAEISKKLGISINTVENYMTSSLAACRRHLTNHPDVLLLLLATIHSL